LKYFSTPSVQIIAASCATSGKLNSQGHAEIGLEIKQLLLITACRKNGIGQDVRSALAAFQKRHQSSYSLLS